MIFYETDKDNCIDSSCKIDMHAFQLWHNSSAYCVQNGG